jgi:hypothetical protein
VIEEVSAALTELGIAIAKLRYVETVLQKLRRDEARRQRNQTEKKEN